MTSHTYPLICRLRGHHRVTVYDGITSLRGVRVAKHCHRCQHLTPIAYTRKEITR